MTLHVRKFQRKIICEEKFGVFNSQMTETLKSKHFFLQFMLRL